MHFCHTKPMPTFTPQATSSILHTVDARVKILLLLAFTISLFFCSHWAGFALYGVMTLGLFGLLKGSRKLFLVTLSPVATLSLMVILIRLLDTNVHTTFEDVLSSAFIALRFILLTAGSLFVALTTSSTQLMSALRWLLSPLQRCGVRTQPAVTVLTMAISFIPRVAEDFGTVYAAQKSRGAHFTSGTILQRLKSFSQVLAPVFISLFRRADTIAMTET